MPEQLPDPLAEPARPPAEVRHLPVPAEPLRPRAIESRPAGEIAIRPRSPLPAPAFAAAAGFLAGIATWLLARAVSPRGRRLPIARRPRGGRGVDIAGSRSFLVDVHLLKR